MKLLALVTTSILFILFLYFYLYVKPSEKSLVRRGVLPKPDDTTIEDIKRLKLNEKYSKWALIRLMQMPEYKDLPHHELKKILDRL